MRDYVKSDDRLTSFPQLLSLPFASTWRVRPIRDDDVAAFWGVSAFRVLRILFTSFLEAREKRRKEVSSQETGSRRTICRITLGLIFGME